MASFSGQICALGKARLTWNPQPEVRKGSNRFVVDKSGKSKLLKSRLPKKITRIDKSDQKTGFGHESPAVSSYSCPDCPAKKLLFPPTVAMAVAAAMLAKTMFGTTWPMISGTY